MTVKQTKEEAHFNTLEEFEHIITGLIKSNKEYILDNGSAWTREQLINFLKILINEKKETI